MYLMTDSISYYGPGVFIMPVLILAVGIYLYWFSRSGQQNGWLS